jgi:hypothetical protein
VNYLIREREVRNIQKLKNLAAEQKISIIISQGLTAKNDKLHSAGGFRYRDTEIHIHEKKGKFSLEVVSPSNYITTKTQNLTFDDDFKRFELPGPSRKKVERIQPEAKGDRTLDDKDQQIIDAAWEVWERKEISITPGKVEEMLDIPRSTARDRMKKLAIMEYEKNNPWLFKVNDNPLTFMVNPKTNRDW